MNNVAILSLEILVAGITAVVWVVLLIVRLFVPDCQIEEVFLKIYDYLSLGNLLLCSVLIYNLGWIVHHLGERLLEPLFQTKWRGKIFSDREFYKIRTAVFQKASNSTMEDIKFDRHVIRISRSNIFNFIALAIVEILYIPVYTTISIIAVCVSALIVVVSFLQWKSRCVGTFKKFKDIYNCIEANENNNTKKEIINENTKKSIQGKRK